MTGSMSLFDTLRRIVREEVARSRSAELAVVQEQHPHADESDKDNYACTVALRDSGIVLKKVPVATQQIGCAAIPEVGELVLVQFIDGDINAPIITGRLYNNEDRPPVNVAQQMVTHLPPGAADDEAVHLEVNSGDSTSIVINIGSAIKLTLVDDDPAVTLDVGDGAAKLSITQGGELVIESQGDLKFTSSGNLELEASGDMNLTGATINLN
jgi:phage baseplate assembly protein gpV